MSESLIRPHVRAMAAYVPGEQPEDAEVLKLNTNENPYPPSPKVFEALGGIDADVLRKYPHPTARELRRALAEGHGLAPENVYVGNGSDEVLALCTRAFVGPGDRVGYLKPSYSLYPVLATIAELVRMEYPLNADFNWTVPDMIETELFWLTRPNAPTGLATPLKDVATAAARCPGVFVVDEAYADFAADNAVGLLGECPNLLISRSFSKSHSLAGLRVGYALGAPELIEALDKIKDSYNLDALAQRMALASFQDQAWTRANVTAVRGTRGDTKRRLEERGFSVPASEANFVFAGVPEGMDAGELYERLHVRKVYVRYFPGPLTGSALRVTIGTDEQMDRFFRELDAVLSDVTV